MSQPFSPEPPSRISLAYFALAHASLAAAAAIMAMAPHSLAGFFYRPRVISTVHLITLGWISSSILGALYMIAPMALRTRLSVRATDWTAFVFYAIGLSGMISHFWIHQPAGMLWSAAMVVLAAAWVGAKTIYSIVSAPIEPASRLAIALAFFNFALAAAVGGFMGWVQAHPSSGGLQFSTLAAHVELAAVGWAVMMILGAGYRLLPMLLPSAPPPRLSSLTSVVLLEAGTLLLAAQILAHRRALMVGMIVLALGILLFLSNIVWMRAHPRRRARNLPRWDPGRLQIFEAALYLLVALALALWVASPARSIGEIYEAFPALVALLLVGFVAQMIAGVSARLFPLFLWIRSFKITSDPPLPPPPGKLPSPLLATLALGAWTAAVPLLAYALARHDPAAMRIAGLLLLVATLASGLQSLAVGRRIAAARRS